MRNEQILTIKFDYKETIAVTDFQEFLKSWNNQFEKQCDKKSGCDKLFIKEIRQGSIIIDMIPMIIPMIENINNLSTFWTNFKSVVNWLTTKDGYKPDLKKNDWKDYKNIVSPVANNVGTQINATFNNSSIVINGEAAKMMLENVHKEIATLQENTLEDGENVLLKLTQIKDDNDESSKSTKGLIESIDKKVFPVLFSNKEEKNSVVHDVSNPFNKNYLVNVRVNRSRGKIISYTIIEILDSYEEETALSA